MPRFKKKLLFSDNPLVRHRKPSFFPITVLGKLRGSSPQISSVGISEPFGEIQDEVRQGFPRQIFYSCFFGGNHLRERLSQVAGPEIKKGQ